MRRVPGLRWMLGPPIAAVGVTLILTCGPQPSPAPSGPSTPNSDNRSPEPVQTPDPPQATSTPLPGEPPDAAATPIPGAVQTPASTPTLTPSERRRLFATPSRPTGEVTIRGEEFSVDQYRPVLPREAILPVYDPEFTTAQAADLLDWELVLGVEINGESKAYPIGPLNFLEMVNDELGGVLILVTW